MFLIGCPWCGPRDQSEFAYGGRAAVARPAAPGAASDEEWGTYLFVRGNEKGRHAERWAHVHGCGRWFEAVRDTRTNEIFATRPPATPSGLGAGVSPAGNAERDR